MKLERLLEHLEPDRVLDVLAARTDEAINSFASPSARITSWDGFRACMIRFVAHVERHALRLQSPYQIDPDFAWGRSVRMLMDKFGPSGEKAAFEMARTGNEGGLYAVFKAVAWRIAEQLAQNEISARVSEYLNGLSAQQRLAASTEYLARFGHLLPAELTEASAARIHANVHKVLEKHPQLMKQFRKIGRGGPPATASATAPKKPRGHGVSTRRTPQN